MVIDQCRRLYWEFACFPQLVEEINDQLFSTSAQKLSYTEREIRSQALTTQLLELQKSLKQANQDEPNREMMFLQAALVLEVALHGLLALVRHPGVSSPTASMQYSDSCVASSRKALQALIDVSKTSVETRPSGWAMWLNTYVDLKTFRKEPLLTGHPEQCR